SAPHRASTHFPPYLPSSRPPPPPPSPLFPYTTLFRSPSAAAHKADCSAFGGESLICVIVSIKYNLNSVPVGQLNDTILNLLRIRSEEHTSELQSHLNLVCRLLLEKKKK